MLVFFATVVNTPTTCNSEKDIICVGPSANLAVGNLLDRDPRSLNFMLLCLSTLFPQCIYIYIYISILVSGLVPDLSLHFLSVKILLSSDQIVCPQIWLTLVQGAPPVTFAHLLSHAGNQPFCCVSNPSFRFQPCKHRKTV